MVLTTVFADAPATLKRQLESVLKLQEKIDELENVIAGAATVMGSTTASAHLRGLEITQSQLSAQAENLYRALNVVAAFPELKGVTFEFVHVLLLARELKMNVRSRVVGRFFEMSRLDQAVAGKDVPLGSLYF